MLPGFHPSPSCFHRHRRISVDGIYICKRCCLPAGTRSSSNSVFHDLSIHSSDIDLIRANSRDNSTTAKQPRALENTGLSDGQPICEVTVSYADEPDLGAVADVLDLLTHANYGR